MSAVNSIGNDISVASSSGRSSLRQAHVDFDQLVQSLQNGNLSGAQQAYAAFQQIQANLTSSPTVQSPTASSNTQSNPVLSDWSNLGSALQGGDLSSAQTALGQLQSDARATWQAHMQQEMQNAHSVYALMQTSQGVSGVSGTSVTGQAGNALQNDLNSLNQALQSGDTASAQKLLAQLEQDLQTSGQRHGHHHHHHGGSVEQNAMQTSATSTTSATDSGTAATNSATASTASSAAAGTAA